MHHESLFFRIIFTHIGQKAKCTVITMAKRGVTVNIDEELVEVMKERNYNISFLCSEALRIYVSEETNEIEVAARLSAIDTHLITLKTEAQKKYLEYQAAENNVDKLQKRRETILSEFLEAQKTLRLSRMIKELNSNIIACEFDVEVVKTSCYELIASIEGLSTHFNLDSHVKRLKNVLL